MSDGDTEMNLADGKYGANKALHRTPIPLRSIAAGELGCYPWDERVEIHKLGSHGDVVYLSIT